MNDAQTALRPWPPAFSEAFIDGAVALFRDTDHVMIVGALGSNRGALATAITGRPALTAWGREAHAYGDSVTGYAAINQLLPNLYARPDESTDQVTDRAQQILASTFGRPAVSLREADLCDDHSVDVLAHLVDARTIRLVSTVGPDTADSHIFARSAARIDLAPLDDETIAQLLSTRFGATPHPTTVAMLAARSQGAYAVLKELADAGFQTGQIKAISGRLITDSAVTVEEVDRAADAAATAWPPRFADDHPARDLIDVAALTMTLPLTEARSAFGDEPVRIALAQGALRMEGTNVVFASRVEASIVRRDLPTDRREALHARYATHLPQSCAGTETPARCAEWMMSIGQDLSAGLAVRATTQANREGRYFLALQIIHTVPADDRPSRLLIEQCHALSESGAGDDLAELLRSIDPHALEDDDLFPFLRWSERDLPHGDFVDLIAESRENTHPANDGRNAVITLAGLIGVAYQNGSETSRRSLMTLAVSGSLSPASQAMAQTALATSLRQSSRLTQAVEMINAAVGTLLADTTDVPICNVETALEAQILCQMSAGDFGAAKDALTVYSRPGLPFGNLGRNGTALWALHAFFTADTASALAQAQQCLARIPTSDPHQMRGWMEAMSAQILTQVGDVAQVRELLAASERHGTVSWRQHALQGRLSRACVHDALGEPEEALVLLQGVVDEARAHDLTLLEVDAAVLCVQIGGPVHLKQLLRAVEPVNETSGTSWIWQRFAWAVRDNDMRALVSLTDELDAEGKALFASEVAQFTLDIARRSTDMSPEQRQRLRAIADPMQHRQINRPD